MNYLKGSALITIGLFILLILFTALNVVSGVNILIFIMLFMIFVSLTFTLFLHEMGDIKYLIFAGGTVIFILLTPLIIWSSFQPPSFVDNVTDATEPLAIDYFGDNVTPSNETPVIKGKVIIQSIVPLENSVLPDVPNELKYTTNETPLNEITVIYINQTEIDIGTWKTEGGNEVPGYQTKTTVVVVYWPEKKVAGKFIIWGQQPPSTAYVPSNAKRVTGESDNMKEWISSLPRQ